MIPALDPRLRRADPKGMDALFAAVGGIQSAATRMAASAHDVANLATERVRPLRTLQVDVAGGAGSRAWSEQQPEPEPADLAHEVVEQIQASLQLRACARVVAATDTTRGALLDLFA